MAAPCVAYSQPFLPRPRAVALLASGLPSDAALAGGPACGCLVDGHPERPSHVARPAHHADRRRLRVVLPLAPATCGDHDAPGCGQRSDALGDHPRKCPRRGLLARHAKVVEQAWCRAAREAVGPEGHVVPQQWLAHTTALGVASDDRRRLDLDATLVSDGTPHAGAPSRDGAVLQVAERRKRSTYPELAQGGRSVPLRARV